MPPMVMEVTGALRNNGDTKVTQEHDVLVSDKDIFWLDVTMNNFAIVSTLECSGYLTHIFNTLFEWKARTFWMHTTK